MKDHEFKPETLMMSYGYKPELSEGALKCPIFQTSTFVFKTAEEGKAFFELAYGHREKRPREEMGLIYSRLNNPDLEILENRLTLWDKAEDCAVFESGMSAISTAMLEFLGPGDLLLYSTPIYGGTHHFINHFLPRFGIEIKGFRAGADREEILAILKKSGKGNRLAMIYIETPANPTNALVDIAFCREVAGMFSSGYKEIPVVVDNTYMGPLWQHPLEHGADLVIYSATKFIGGHSDVIAGACLGSKKLISRIKTLRTFLGNMAGPWTGWLLMRSLETLKPRMELQAENASQVAKFLRIHPKVIKVNYLGFIPENDETNYRIFKKQCLSGGAMISFEIRGGESEAFQFLNSLKQIHLAVSLGGTESLAEHPASMTHSDVDSEERKAMGVTDNLIRISVGIENIDDLLWDLGQALEQVPNLKSAIYKS
ncbi:MAG TPA: cystathionine gamma-synthase family protein [Cyclobacteriaceae bacterium]|nr:cystathionine gamma-synthase family protein [Cyclobacteriaceae bacterium]